MIKHIFWDWNGTLINDASYCASIINRILSDHDLSPISYNQYRQTFGFPVKSFYKTLGLSSIGVSFEETSSDFIKYYQEGWKSCSLQEGVLETLEEISKFGVDQSIITAGKENLLSEYVNYFDLAQYFNGLVGVSHIHASGKEARATEYAKSLELKSGEVLMIGDTIHDHEVGIALGAKVLLVKNGHQEPERLKKLGSKIIGSVNEVLNFLSV